MYGAKSASRSFPYRSGPFPTPKSNGIGNLKSVELNFTPKYVKVGSKHGFSIQRRLSNVESRRITSFRHRRRLPVTVLRRFFHSAGFPHSDSSDFLHRVENNRKASMKNDRENVRYSICLCNCEQTNWILPFSCTFRFRTRMNFSEAFAVFIKISQTTDRKRLQFETQELYLEEACRVTYFLIFRDCTGRSF